MIIDFGKGNGGGAGGGFPEAPFDGKLYGRKDANWSEVIADETTFTFFVPIYGPDGNVTSTGEVPAEFIELNRQEMIRAINFATNDKAGFERRKKIKVNLIANVWQNSGSASADPRYLYIFQADIAKFDVENKNRVEIVYTERVSQPNLIVEGYILKDGTFQKRSVGIYGMFEAPKNGKTYGRKDGWWVEVTGGGGSASAPEIGPNGNWIIDGVDTGKPSRGEQGPQGDMGNQGEKGDPGEKGDQGDMGNQGEPGKDGMDGKDGTVVTAGEDGFWYFDGIKSDKPWKGEPGTPGVTDVYTRQEIDDMIGAANNRLETI